MKPIYGPVPSWRLGRSLGIDPIMEKKTCSFDCVYCQLGKTINKTSKRKIFVNENIIKKQLKEIIKKVKADVVTISGTGEPTLAKNLGKIIDNIRKSTYLPVAVLTNSSLIYKKEVRDDLKKADIVVVKLDAPNEELLKKINKPVRGITFEKILNNIKKFRKEFNGKLAIQIMFIKENKNCASELAKLVKELKPDEVQIDTPLRPCAVKALSKKETKKIKSKFNGLNVISVYEAKKPRVKVLNMHETLLRRPNL